ncbi:hypothetical protein CSUB01_05490 [Colletotrichum sublineola]|uniref:Uncharacterized protein n=1 Tax=Colletotrichum sublineola TaxID=1173701 RepID=A0A066X0X3_COLSU|nr:hypothetical protein CSUB01_05490 [Colletotrichum sublineola]
MPLATWSPFTWYGYQDEDKGKGKDKEADKDDKDDEGGKDDEDDEDDVGHPNVLFLRDNTKLTILHQISDHRNYHGRGGPLFTPVSRQTASTLFDSAQGYLLVVSNLDFGLLLLDALCWILSRGTIPHGQITQRNIPQSPGLQIVQKIILQPPMLQSTPMPQTIPQAVAQPVCWTAKL